jgi:hypothetical protein
MVLSPKCTVLSFRGPWLDMNCCMVAVLEWRQFGEHLESKLNMNCCMVAVLEWRQLREHEELIYEMFLKLFLFETINQFGNSCINNTFSKSSPNCLHLKLHKFGTHDNSFSKCFPLYLYMALDVLRRI